MSLPSALTLSPHLSAHKYFFVCTLTVAAWDTLVLSPRTWQLLKTSGWPPLKTIFHFLRLWMPIEFAIVGVAFFDTKWSQATCRRFFLFEPIATAVLLAAASAVHVIRLNAIYERSKLILCALAALYFSQIVVTGIASGFYRSMPLLEGQGCIAGPKANWVGIYWVFPALLYVTTFVLAVLRSLRTLQLKPLTPWKLMLRDGLNLYGTIAIVNLVNVLFWFIATPTGPDDTIKTIVTSMTAVLTTSMTLRIVLNLRGDLANGGPPPGSSTIGSSRATHGMSTGPGRSTGPIGTSIAPTYTLDEMRSSAAAKADGDWYTDHTDTDGKASVKAGEIVNIGRDGVQIKVDREVELDAQHVRR